MTVVVCVRFVPDPEQVRTDATSGGPDLRRAQWRTSPLDEHALEAALSVRARTGDRLVAVSAVAERPPEHVLRRVLARGADELHLLCGPPVAGWDALALAERLAALVRALGEVSLVVAGAMSSDASRGEVGVRLAEELGGWPVAGQVLGLRLVDDGAGPAELEVDRADGAAVEVVRVPLPAVVVVGSEANRPRLPSIRDIAASAARPVMAGPAPEHPEAVARLRTVSVQAPFSGRRCQTVEGSDAEDRAGRLLTTLLTEGVMSL